MKHAHNNPATHFAMLLMALAMSLAFLACEEKSKKVEAGVYSVRCVQDSNLSL
jgi:hypothetical protein